MKILLTHRFFWPDAAPYGVMLRTLGELLIRDGHTVSVLTSMPSYHSAATPAPKRQNLEGVHVRRIRVFQREKSAPLLRLLNVVIYCLALLREVLRQRPDVVTASTFPPVIAAAFACFAARCVGAKFIYHVQDIHPDISRLTGDRLGAGGLYHLLRWLDTRTMTRADAVVTLSEDMRDTLRARGVDAERIKIIPNFALESFDPGGKTEPETAKRNVYRVIFAGNFGRFQDLPILVEGISQCFDEFPNLHLHLLGSGVLEHDLKDRWAHHPRVTFSPFVPYDEAQHIIRNADLGLVSLMPGMSRLASPSKIATYQSLGLPILLLSDPESALCRGLEESGLGHVAKSRTPEGIAASLRAALRDTGLKRRAEAFSRSDQLRAAPNQAWSDLFGALAV